jgi:hypothetical protein
MSKSDNLKCTPISLTFAAACKKNRSHAKSKVRLIGFVACAILCSITKIKLPSASLSGLQKKIVTWSAKGIHFFQEALAERAAKLLNYIICTMKSISRREWRLG